MDNEITVDCASVVEVGYYTDCGGFPLQYFARFADGRTVHLDSKTVKMLNNVPIVEWGLL